MCLLPSTVKWVTLTTGSFKARERERDIQQRERMLREGKGKVGWLDFGVLTAIDGPTVSRCGGSLIARVACLLLHVDHVGGGAGFCAMPSLTTTSARGEGEVGVNEPKKGE